MKYSVVFKGNKQNLTSSMSGDEPARKQNPFDSEMLYNAFGRSATAEGLEHQPHRPLNLLIRIEDHLLMAIIDESDRGSHV
jgi:hypothetical protein